MIRRLADEACVPCGEGEGPLPAAELAALCEMLNRWRLDHRGGVARIMKVFEFHSSDAGQEFAQRLVSLAEREDHHPEIHREETRVTVVWWTHRIRGLHRNDFIMAARTDRLLD